MRWQNYNKKRFKHLISELKSQSVLILEMKKQINKNYFKVAQLISDQAESAPELTTKCFGHEIISLAKLLSTQKRRIRKKNLKP